VCQLKLYVPSEEAQNVLYIWDAVLPHQIASKRLADQIPMVIRYMLLQEAALELQRNMLQLLHDKDGVDNLLKEDFDIGQKREGLLSRQKRLMKARSLLVTY